MKENKPNTSRSAGIFIASLFVVAVNAYLVGKFSHWQILDYKNFSASYLVLGLVSGFVLATGFSSFILREWFREKRLRDAIHDDLTGLYTRMYMNEVAPRFVSLHKRNPVAGFSLCLLELEDYDSLLNEKGRRVVNRIFSSLGILVMETIRETDLAVRFDDRRIAIFSSSESLDHSKGFVERLKSEIASMQVLAGNEKITPSVNCGLVYHHSEESLSSLVNRADTELQHASQPQQKAEAA